MVQELRRRFLLMYNQASVTAHATAKQLVVIDVPAKQPCSLFSGLIFIVLLTPLLLYPVLSAACEAFLKMADPAGQ